MDKQIELIMLSAGPAEFEYVRVLICDEFHKSHPNCSIQVIPQGYGVRFLLRGQFVRNDIVWKELLENRMPDVISGAFAWTAEPSFKRDQKPAIGSHHFYLLISVSEGHPLEGDPRKALEEIAGDRLFEVLNTEPSVKTVDGERKKKIDFYVDSHQLAQQRATHKETKYVALIVIEPSDGKQFRWGDSFLQVAKIRDTLYKNLFKYWPDEKKKDWGKWLSVEIVPVDVLASGNEYLSPQILLEEAVSSWRAKDDRQRSAGTIRFSWWRDSKVVPGVQPEVEVPCSPIAILGRKGTGKSVLASHVLALAATTRLVRGRTAPLRVVYLNYKGFDHGCVRNIEEIQHLAFAWDDASHSSIQICSPKSLPALGPPAGQLLYTEIGGNDAQVEDSTRAIIEAAGQWRETVIVFDEIINFCRDRGNFSLLGQLATIVDRDESKSLFPILIGHQLQDFARPELGSFRDVAAIVITALNDTAENAAQFEQLRRSRPGRLRTSELSFKEASGNKYEIGTFFLSVVADQKYGLVPQRYPLRNYPPDAAELRKKFASGLPFDSPFGWTDFLKPQ